MSNTSVKYLSSLVCPLLIEPFTIAANLAQAPGRRTGLWLKYKFIFQ